MTNLSHNFFTDFIVCSFLWYLFKALDGTQYLAARLDIYKNKGIYHKNVSLSKIKLLKSQKPILTCGENGKNR